MAANSKIKRSLEKKGWSFKFIHSSSTSHLKKAPVIAEKGSRTVKGTSLSDVFKKIRGY